MRLRYLALLFYECTSGCDGDDANCPAPLICCVDKDYCDEFKSESIDGVICGKKRSLP